jgi:hypothetical protein
MIEQRLALVRDRDHVRDGAIAQTRDGALLDQPLAFERVQIRAGTRLVSTRPSEVVREHRPEARRSLQQIDFRSTEVVHPCLIPHGFAIGT